MVQQIQVHMTWCDTVLIHNDLLVSILVNHLLILHYSLCGDHYDQHIKPSMDESGVSHVEFQFFT